MKNSKSRIAFQCINYTILFLLMAAALYPVLYVLAASLSSFEFLAQGKVGIIPMGFTLDAYKRILSYPMLDRAYLNTIFYTIAGTFISMLLSSISCVSIVEKAISRTEIHVKRSCGSNAIQRRNDTNLSGGYKTAYV